MKNKYKKINSLIRFNQRSYKHHLDFRSIGGMVKDSVLDSISLRIEDLISQKRNILLKKNG